MNTINRICVLSFALVAGTCSAGVVVEQHAEGQDGLTVYRMTVTPAPEPVPALKHRLTLRPHERKPGNAATHYLRSVWENGIDTTWVELRKRVGEDKFDSWNRIADVPLEELPLVEVREAASIFSHQVDSFIDPASRCRECEWGLAEEDLRGMETIAFLLPDTQGSRTISRVLTLLTRLAIAERRFDEAINYMRMNYQLGQDFGKQKFLVSNLIGIAEVQMANRTIIDLIAAPDSPNMFWALSELPRPIVPMRESIRLEMSLGPRIFPILMNVEQQELSVKEWSRILNQIAREGRDLGGGLDDLPNQGFLSRLTMTGLSIVAYPAAKQRLLESGMDKEKVERMPVGQVILVDAAREWQRIADEYEKWQYIDYSQAVGRMNEADKRFSPNKIEGGFGQILARTLIPAVQAARSAGIRTQWEMDALRVIEAIRMHAAETGSLPSRLDQIQVVPVPLNPITRHEYVYRLKGSKGVLELPFSDGMPGQAHRFEITLAK